MTKVENVLKLYRTHKITFINNVVAKKEDIKRFVIDLITDDFDISIFSDNNQILYIYC